MGYSEIFNLPFGVGNVVFVILKIRIASSYVCFTLSFSYLHCEFCLISVELCFYFPECDIRSCLNTLQFLNKKNQTLNVVRNDAAVVLWNIHYSSNLPDEIEGLENVSIFQLK